MPSGRAIADGIQLLQELGGDGRGARAHRPGRRAVAPAARPARGSAILEARERGALREVLIIAAALSVQDVRDRPLEQQAQADQAHAV